MENAARIVMIVYGILMLGGGIGGYAMAHSKPSLIAGITSAVLMGVALYLSRQSPKIGFGMGVGLAIVLGLFFIHRIQATHKIMPNAGLSGLSFIVAVILGLALFQARS